MCSLTIVTKQSSQNQPFIEVFGLSEKVGGWDRDKLSRPGLEIKLQPLVAELEHIHVAGM